MPMLKNTPAACAMRASRHKTAARGAPPPSISRFHHASSRFPASRRASFPATACTPLNPSAARRRMSQAKVANTSTNHCPPIRMARKSVTLIPPRSRSNRPSTAGNSREKRDQRQPAADHRECGGEFPAAGGFRHFREPGPQAGAAGGGSVQPAGGSDHDAPDGRRRVPGDEAAACSKSTRSSKVHRCDSLAIEFLGTGGMLSPFWRSACGTAG